MYGPMEPGWAPCPACGARVAGRCPACVVGGELLPLPELYAWDRAVWLVVAVALAVMAWRIQ